MAKKVLVMLLQAVVFFLLLMVGGNWDSIRLSMEIKAMQLQRPMPAMIPLWKVHISASHDLILNGIVYAAALLVLILLIQAIARVTRRWSGWSILAYVIAVAVSLIVKLGLPPANS